ncbi:hypothetical protein BCR43DRAFT_509318 [Syncephalastrum racemosum]|uniref:Uncharacterized protein n=1 Tax=Syncephalastrum racemosum TaxID=13706 RepID=A0A1X2GYU4_SYNRA|nr:hypothetical protein BCR43DRAFT_509318 [Syncephalastrum racemosum]
MNLLAPTPSHRDSLARGIAVFETKLTPESVCPVLNKIYFKHKVPYAALTLPWLRRLALASSAMGSSLDRTPTSLCCFRIKQASRIPGLTRSRLGMSLPDFFTAGLVTVVSLAKLCKTDLCEETAGYIDTVCTQQPFEYKWVLTVEICVSLINLSTHVNSGKGIMEAANDQLLAFF